MALQSSKIPPQAYTRDTLVKAIEWLTTQPPAVRERANSADLIVSHYLQARRTNSAAQNEAPVSTENFKADLRHLAEDLKRFDEPSAPPQPQPTRSPAYVQPVMEFRRELRAEPLQTMAMTPQPPAQQVVVQTVVAPQPPPAPQPVHHEPLPKGPVWQIDPRSLTVARELQDRLNLSSEGEAIRMLISFGAERARLLLE